MTMQVHFEHIDDDGSVLKIATKYSYVANDMQRLRHGPSVSFSPPPLRHASKPSKPSKPSKTEEAST